MYIYLKRGKFHKYVSAFRHKICRQTYGMFALLNAMQWTLDKQLCYTGLHDCTSCELLSLRKQVSAGHDGVVLDLWLAVVWDWDVLSATFNAVVIVVNVASSLAVQHNVVGVCDVVLISRRRRRFVVRWHPLVVQFGRPESAGNSAINDKYLSSDDIISATAVHISNRGHKYLMTAIW